MLVSQQLQPRRFRQPGPPLNHCSKDVGQLECLQFEMLVPFTQPLDGMSQSLLESTFVMTVAA